MSFNELLAVIHVDCSQHQTVQGIEEDSRKIKKDYLFICRSENKREGYPYVQEALDKGAVVLWEKESEGNCYHVDSVNEVLPILLNTWYQNPSASLCTIGVTGTNGKTSVTLILRQLLMYCEAQVMVIGTHHIRFLDHDIPIENTTPSACTLAYYFHQAVAYNISYVLMEVSSHAIDQNRICFISFDYLLYTNVMEDHLDYHLTSTHYMYTKFKLRSYLKEQGVIIMNHDVENLYPMYQLSDDKIITFGLKQAHYHIHNIHYFADYTSFCLDDVAYEMKLLGKVNVYNVCEALLVMYQVKYTIAQCQQAVFSLQCIAGRLEVMKKGNRYIWIDYAHTESALAELLMFANYVKQANVICVVGCGGNREKEKRSKMADVALSNSDIAIFTADNPRDEEVHEILYAMIKDTSHKFKICENRACAIKTSMKIAQTHDIIVIAGKGDETTQEVQGKKYPFQDREWVELYSDMED